MSTENAMGVKPVFPLLIGMSLPPIISMLIQSMYNVVDSIFLARLSQEALAAVSLIYPLQNMVLAVGVGFGIGINSCMSRSLGAKNEEETNLIAAHGVICSAVHSLIFVLVGLFLTKPFLRLFTQDEVVFEMGATYGYVVICLAFGSLFHIFIEKIFQATGNMVVPMFLQIAGAVINIVLDPILIFGYFGFPAMGVLGAAIATVLGQMTACGLAVLLFIKQKDGVRADFKHFHLDMGLVKKIYAVAIPSGMMTALPSVLVGVLNGILVGFSQTAVAVFGVYIKLQSFVYMPANGVIQGMRPIVGYCYGAKKFDRIHETIRYSILTVGAIMILGTILFMAAPGPIMLLFGAEGAMMEIGKAALRILSIGFVISTVSLVYAGSFEAVGDGMGSLIVNLIRQFVIIPPLAFLLSKTVLGLHGVWISFPIAEAIALIVAIVMRKRKNELMEKMEKMERGNKA